MSFTGNAVEMQAVIYAELGLPAFWTPAGQPAPAAPNVTVIMASPPASDDAGPFPGERPRSTPSWRVRIRTSDLTAQGLMALDAVSQSPAPVWSGATVNFDGVARKVLTKPEPADALYRLEWVFDLA